jgi:hypothetical protein
MKKLIYFLIFIFVSIPAFADNASSPNPVLGGMNHHEFQNSLNNFGISYTLNKNVVEIDINQDKALESVPSMQTSGMMNPDITQTEINTNPVMYAGLIGLVFSGLIVNDVYTTTNSDNLIFKGYLLSADDYGNMKKHLTYTFAFSRNLFNKINWKNFSTNGIPKIAPNFKFSEWYTNQT